MIFPFGHSAQLSRFYPYFFRRGAKSAQIGSNFGGHLPSNMEKCPWSVARTRTPRGIFYQKNGYAVFLREKT
jgi:hypothetical protein